MYSTRSGLILAFHGCDETVRDEVVKVNGKLNKSNNSYDWLGHGIYFWENSPSRALEFAQYLKSHPERSKSKIITPSVIGAVIDLGYCLDLLDYKNLPLLKTSYEILAAATKNIELPQNKSLKGSNDLLMRNLDCAVIETLHSYINEKKELEYDSVKGVFWEGKELYPNAGFREKDHIQICVRNPNCIKGYFIPREIDKSFKRV